MLTIYLIILKNTNKYSLMNRCFHVFFEFINILQVECTKFSKYELAEKLRLKAELVGCVMLKVARKNETYC